MGDGEGEGGDASCSSSLCLLPPAGINFILKPPVFCKRSWRQAEQSPHSVQHPRVDRRAICSKIAAATSNVPIRVPVPSAGSLRGRGRGAGTRWSPDGSWLLAGTREGSGWWWGEQWGSRVGVTQPAPPQLARSLPQAAEDKGPGVAGRGSAPP